MPFGTYGELRQAVQNYAGRSDTRFVTRIPDFVTLAEHRIFYGSDERQPTEAVRVRAMEVTDDIATNDEGKATLDPLFIEFRRLYWEADPRQRLAYQSPQEFHTSIQNYQDGTAVINPLIFTVEGAQLLVAPPKAGTVRALCWKRFAALSDDSDTNWLMQNAPGVYFNAAMSEAWKFARNVPRQEESLSALAGLVASLNKTENRARRAGAELSPQTVRSRTDRR